MKKLAIAIAAIALIGTPAFAQAPPPPSAPVYNWTGWYAGVNAGASFGSAKTDFNVTPFVVATIPVTPGFAGSHTEYPAGFMGGGQIGYNWQYSPLIVVGLEADFQGALERDSVNLSNSFGFPFPGPPNPFTVTGTQVTDYTTKIEWFGTVRGRIGYVWGNGNVLSYLTGGLAYGKVDLEGTNTFSGAVFNNTTLINTAVFSGTQAFGHSQVSTGWVLGYGTEGVIDFWGARNWTWKIEGLYMDLGHLDTTGVTTGTSITGFICGGPCPTSGAQVSTHSHFTDGILRAGLNYKFY
jgi:outer membrane immunogenic protein